MHLHDKCQNTLPVLTPRGAEIRTQGLIKISQYVLGSLNMNNLIEMESSVTRVYHEIYLNKLI